jgi:sterol desaturase/sphingolipid hydroxylase (fatty acid hydroxylase superfamily)
MKEPLPQGPLQGMPSSSWTRHFVRPVRFFERISSTRANARAGLVSDILVAVVLLLEGLRRQDVHVAPKLLAILTGLFLFSFVEYAFHRWLFHGAVALTERGHRKHHEQPLAHDSLPFFLSPLLILTLTGLLATVMSATLALLLSGGLAAGYAAYGLSHLLIHKRRFHRVFARRWSASHHIHHVHPESNFGVTSPLWDVLLGTRYVRQGKAGTR